MNEIRSNALQAKFVTENNKSEEKLILIENLLFAFHNSAIIYCHWKSNEHLDASFKGDTDLDILFDKNQKNKLQLILDQLGFRRFNSISQKQYKDIEDFIGLDQASGKIVHLHAHFRLTLGESYLKSYQLDLEDKILGGRLFDLRFGIYCIQPAFELILLYIREALKIRNRDILRLFTNKVRYAENIMREYRWLKQRSTDQEIRNILETIFVNYQPVYEIITGKFNRSVILKLSFLIRKELKNERMFSTAGALLRRWYREIFVKIYRKSSLLLNGPVISKRINPRGGLVVAVIGADGSGKSTVIANLRSTFKTKLDVYSIYLGRGEGKMSWPRKLLLSLKKRYSRLGNNKMGTRLQQSAERGKKGLTASAYKIIEALLVANEKKRNLKRMRVAKKKGMLVICDRFPQNQTMGYNDGPLLHKFTLSSNVVKRLASRIEVQAYAFAESNPPDIVFKLIADARIVEARKPNEIPLNILETKIAGIQKLKFRKSCKVITVDAAQPLDKVLEIIKKEIWEACP